MSPHADTSLQPSKLHPLSDAVRLVTMWRRWGNSVGVTNGCFDVLHAGHVYSLCQLRRRVGSVVVLLNSDASVRAAKGASRPVYTQTQRAYMLSALEYVSAVVIFDGPNCAWQIQALGPDLYCKGEEWRETQDTAEKAALEACGARVVWLRRLPNVSTTRVAARCGVNEGLPAGQTEIPKTDPNWGSV